MPVSNGSSLLTGASALLRLALICGIILPVVQAGETAPAAPNGTNAPTARLRLFTDKAPLGGRLQRGVLQVGHNQFSFVVPEGFRSVLDSGTGKMQLISADSSAVITIEVRPSPQEPVVPVDAGKLRELVLAQHQGGRVLDEFEVAVENWRGSAIEIEWAASPVKKNSLRLAHIPLPGGTLVFTVRASSDHIRACDHPFHQLLLSIRAGLNGANPAFQQHLAQQ